MRKARATKPRTPRETAVYLAAVKALHELRARLPDFESQYGYLCDDERLPHDAREAIADLISQADSMHVHLKTEREEAKGMSEDMDALRKEVDRLTDELSDAQANARKS